MEVGLEWIAGIIASLGGAVTVLWRVQQRAGARTIERLPMPSR